MALAACLMPGAFAQSPAITDSRFVDGAGGESARLDLDVASEPLSRVGIVHSSTLDGAWREVAPPVVATAPRSPLSVPLADYGGKGFFREVVSPPRVKVGFEKDEIFLSIEDKDVGLDEVLVAHAFPPGNDLPQVDPQSPLPRPRLVVSRLYREDDATGRMNSAVRNGSDRALLPG